MTVADIKLQLEQLKRIVIAKEILHSVYQKSFKECLKKILQHTGLFSPKELDIVFWYPQPVLYFAITEVKSTPTTTASKFRKGFQENWDEQRKMFGME